MRSTLSRREAQNKLGNSEQQLPLPHGTRPRKYDSPILRTLKGLLSNFGEWKRSTGRILFVIAFFLLLIFVGSRIFRKIFHTYDSDDEVVKKSLTFCLSPGRVGSDYLALLLNLTVDTYAVHEPYPQLAGFPLRQVLKEPLEDSFELRKKLKIPYIMNILRRPSVKHYVETSHMYLTVRNHLLCVSFSRQVYQNLLRCRHGNI